MKQFSDALVHNLGIIILTSVLAFMISYAIFGSIAEIFISRSAVKYATIIGAFIICLTLYLVIRPKKGAGP
jgi:hypothetical protein